MPCPSLRFYHTIYLHFFKKPTYKTFVLIIRLTCWKRFFEESKNCIQFYAIFSCILNNLLRHYLQFISLKTFKFGILRHLLCLSCDVQ